MNLDNNNNNTGHYPLYLGEDLGVLDNINETYPELAKLHRQLLDNRWSWWEIDLTKDAVDMQNPELAEGTKIMIRNLNFQHATDSLAAESIGSALLPFCSNTEGLGLIQEWASGEFVHGMQYSQITKKSVASPNEVLEDLKNTHQLISRLQPMMDVINATAKMAMLYKLGLETDIPRMRKQIILCHGTLLALEGVVFGGSFAATFAVARAYKAYDGIVKAVQLITRDELDQHVDIGLKIMKILRKEWPHEYEAMLPEIAKIYVQIQQLESDWGESWLFEDVRVRGFNAALVERYSRWLFQPICESIGLPDLFEWEKEHPLPWMEDYLNLGDIQVAAQESQLNLYNVNVIVDDVPDNMTFSFNP